jgi:3-oxoacyl-(acyl-carrier-protein) synthase
MMKQTKAGPQTENLLEGAPASAPESAPASAPSSPILRAAIKGCAWRTPLGSDIDTVTRRLLAGERAARPNPRFDASQYACTLAAAIDSAPGQARARRYLRRMGLFACDVAHEALAASGISVGVGVGIGVSSGVGTGDGPRVAPERIGLFFGYGGLRAHWDDLMPAFEQQRADAHEVWQRGLTLLHPFWMLQHLSNNAHAIAAQELQARGDGATYGGANAGVQALSAAIRALALGVVDVALVVAYDTLNEPEMLVELAARGVLTPAGTGAQVAAPYAHDAAGFVPGEAAAALVLQRPEAGGIAYVQAKDAADGSLDEAQVSTLARLAHSLAQSGDWFDGAGLALGGFDMQERSALSQLAGADAPLCCTLSAMGQLGAANSIVQAIAMSALLQRQMLAPVAGLQQANTGPLRPQMQAQASNARGALALAAGAPGLAGVVRVALD